MQHETLLIGISQLGAVFAGFIAIALAFARREEKMDVRDSLRTRSILHSSFCAIFGPLVPLVLHAMPVDDSVIWPASGAISLLLATALISGNIRFQLKMTATERRDAGLSVTLAPWLIAATGMSILAWVTFANGGAGFYILAMAIALTIASWNFIELALKRWL
jgi:hypothetical protein